MEQEIFDVIVVGAGLSGIGAAYHLRDKCPDRSVVILEARDAICILTHDPKFDVPAVQSALATNAGYIGAMGSRRTTDDRNRRLEEVGVDPSELQRVMAPIGLDIGGRTPEETAISICAEIIALHSGRIAPSLRDAEGDIHRQTA